ncbi:MAG: rhodanese-related sulfurtransferase [Candidatus Marinimicrobia bacterium]|jgi:UPF0176 protein|nr:rhodanese-related sulfurtransferase [Candidatus Neomarinimicrobiota bacterium]
MFNKKSQLELKRDLEQETFQRITCSFYRYINIKNPESFRNHLYEEFSRLNILGRVYIAQEGVNAQISVPEDKWNTFEDYINSEALLSEVKLKRAVQEGISFIKLKIVVKNEIVAYGVHKDSYDMDHVGQHLSAKEFNESIKQEESIVVDMRNYYESEVGRFENAITPDIHRSQELLSEVAELISDSKDKKVHLYCTGGIRCEKASAFLIKKGFKDVYQLDGGIIQYAHDIKKENIPSAFIGKNFVFDDRLGEKITDDIIGKCHQCQNPCDQHVNCSNDACHILFIQCEDCATKYERCCSDNCRDFNALDVEEKRKLRKDIDKKVSGAKLSTKFRPKVYKLFNYWK